MSDPQPGSCVRPQSAPDFGRDSVLSLVSAGLFLFVGFAMGLVGISESALYNGSVTALVWGARVIGIGILVVMALEYLRLGLAIVLDLMIAVLATVLCLVVGLIWIISTDLQGFLLLLFGLLNGSTALAAWQRWRVPRRAAERARPATSESAAEHGPPLAGPPGEASIRPGTRRLLTTRPQQLPRAPEHEPRLPHKSTQHRP